MVRAKTTLTATCATLSENRQKRVKITWKNLEALLAFCGFLRSLSDIIKQDYRDCCRSGRNKIRASKYLKKIKISKRSVSNFLSLKCFSPICLTKAMTSFKELKIFRFKIISGQKLYRRRMRRQFAQISDTIVFEVFAKIHCH